MVELPHPQTGARTPPDTVIERARAEHGHSRGREDRCRDEPPSVDEETVRLTVRQRTGTIVEAVRRLDEAGVAVDDLGLRRPTLDDVFLSLTGHAAEAADDEQEEEAA